MITISVKAIRIPLFVVALAAGILAATTTPGAAAADLAGAKASGLVGETAGGYLSVVAGKTVDAATDRLIKDINLQRQQQYRVIAQKNNVSVEAVAALAGKKIVEREPAGNWVRVNGQWLRK